MALRRFSTSNISGSKSSKVWDGETFPGYFESIATVTVGSAGASSIEFTNIPQNYTHLQVRLLTKNSSASGTSYWYLLMNGDTGFSYSNHQIYGNGTTAAGPDLTSSSGGYAGWGPAITPGTSDSNIYASSVVDILDYTNTNKNTTIRGLHGYDANGSGTISLISTLWLNTAAITSLTWYRSGATMTQYTHAALYGIRSA